MQVTINDDRVITGVAIVGGLSGGIPIDLEAAPPDLALGYYVLSGPSLDDDGQPLEPYEIQYDQERHRLYRASFKPVPPEMCKPYFDLDTDAWIETATPEELAEWVPPVPLETLPDKVDRIEQEGVATMIAVTEAYETGLQQTAQREQETVTTMMATTELYELVLQQQATIDALTARIAALEGGGE